MKIPDIDDEFWFDGELLANVEVDEDGDYCLRYRIDEGLMLGAVKLFCQWQKDMYEKYK